MLVGHAAQSSRPLPFVRAPRIALRIALRHAAAALRDGVAYVGTAGGMFDAVDAASGRFVWSFAAARPIHGAAAVDGDAISVVCDDGWMFKLRREDGAELWRYDLGDARAPRVLMPQVVGRWAMPELPGVWGFFAPAAVDGGRIVVGGLDGTLYGFPARGSPARELPARGLPAR